MKAVRWITYRRITRLIYLLGVVFLLAGMSLSLVSQPAQAGSPARPTRGVQPPVVRTPEGPQPSSPTQPPAHNPDNPGVPGNRVPGRNSQSFNFGGLGAPNNPTPPIRVMAATGSVRWTQSDYCYSEPAESSLEATVEVLLPEGESAVLVTEWYIVHPNPYTPNPELNNPSTHHLETPVQNGDSLEVTAVWPGANLYNPADPEYSTIEVHWDAWLVDESGTAFGQSDQLDAYFNGECTARVLTVSHSCTDDGRINWSVTNHSGNEVTFTYTFNDGRTGLETISEGTAVFATTNDGAYTVTISWEDGVGGVQTLEDRSIAGQCQPLVIAHACRPGGGIDWTVHNTGESEITFTWSVSPGGESGSITVGAGQTVGDIYTTQGGEQTVTVTYTDGQGQEHSRSDVYNDDNCQSSLTVSHACHQGGGVEWILYNPGGPEINFTWSVSPGGETGSGSISPGGSAADIFTTQGGPQTLTVTYTDYWGSQQTVTDTYSDENCLSLVLDPFCPPGMNSVEWYVINPNAGPVDFTWWLDTGPHYVSNVPGSDTAYITTAPTLASRTMHLEWEDELGLHSISFTNPDYSEEAACKAVPPPLLKIAARCFSEGRIEWVAINDSEVEIPFDWVYDSGKQTGKSTVGASERSRFLVSPSGQHTVTISWLWDDVLSSVSYTTRKEFCSQPPTVVVPPPDEPPVSTPGTTTPVVTSPGTPTPVPTLQVPNPTPAIGVAVTGVNLHAVSTPVLYQRLFTNLGLLLLGIAFLLTGLAGRFR